MKTYRIHEIPDETDRYCRAMHLRECYAKIKYGVRSTKFIWAPRVQLYSLAETPQSPPPPSAFGLMYEGATDQPR